MHRTRRTFWRQFRHNGSINGARSAGCRCRDASLLNADHRPLNTRPPSWPVPDWKAWSHSIFAPGSRTETTPAASTTGEPSRGRRSISSCMVLTRSWRWRSRTEPFSATAMWPPCGPFGKSTPRHRSACCTAARNRSGSQTYYAYHANRSCAGFTLRARCGPPASHSRAASALCHLPRRGGYCPTATQSAWPRGQPAIRKIPAVFNKHHVINSPFLALPRDEAHIEGG